LEEGLLELDGEVAPERIHELFRLVHTMKGGAGAAGVVEIGALVHATENILDTLRRGEPLAPETSGLLLRGVDAIRGSLRARRDGLPVATSALIAITAEVERHAKASRTLAAAPRSTRPRWTVTLTPRAEVLRAGGDPNVWLGGLVELGGEVEADLARLPAFDAIDPSTCHLAWRVSLPDEVTRAAVE